jgi:hypothetical protein
MFTFHYGLLVSNRFFQKKKNFFFNDLLKHMLICISYLLRINFINFLNQKVGLNTYFSFDFKCIFYLLLEFISL